MLRKVKNLAFAELSGLGLAGLGKKDLFEEIGFNGLVSVSVSVLLPATALRFPRPRRFERQFRPWPELSC